MLYVLGAALQFVWLGSAEALVDGYLWVLVAINVIGVAVIGCFLGILAMARSRDAFGGARNGALAFIPLANLILLLSPTKNESSTNAIATLPLLTGRGGVLIGIVIFVVGVALSTVARTQNEALVERGAESTDPKAQQAGVRFSIYTMGLGPTLAWLAPTVRVPQVVDEWTTIVMVKATGNTLRYTYSVTADPSYFTASFRTGLIEFACRSEMPLRPVLQAGGIIEHSYTRPDSSEIGTVVIGQDSCLE